MLYSLAKHSLCCKYQFRCYINCNILDRLVSLSKRCSNKNNLQVLSFFYHFVLNIQSPTSQPSHLQYTKRICERIAIIIIIIKFVSPNVEPTNSKTLHLQTQPIYNVMIYKI